MTTDPHIVIGGGAIGLAIGWQLARAGERVEIYDESAVARSGASWVAAGMLAPQAEAGYEEEALFRLCVQSLAEYDLFLSQLCEDVKTARVPEVDRCGSLLVAVTSDDRLALERQFAFRQQLQCTGMQMLSGNAAREREPLLSPKVKAALWLEDEAQINNRALVVALQEAFVNCGGVINEYAPVEEVVVSNGRVTGIRSRGEVRAASSVIVAAGASAAKINGLEDVGLRPVKGQVASLKMVGSPALRTLIRTPRVYLARKDDDRLLIGASVEERGYDRAITAGPIMELLHYACEAVPLVYELEVGELQSGLRPATRDNCPILGEGNIERLFYAVGHYRNGILLTPLTAFAIRDLVQGRSRSDILPFGLNRLNKVRPSLQRVKIGV